MTDRNERLRKGLQRTDPVIEIGPLHGPIVPKAQGWATTIVDHAPRADLVRKYTGHPGVDTGLIEEVDVVWRGGPLHEAFPPEAIGRYAMLIASHVIEHMPDPIGFLDSAARLTDPERGVLALAVPDKRWCFDLLKPVSTTGQMLEAHRAGQQRHSAATLFDHNAYSASDRGRTGWGREPITDLEFYVGLQDAKAAFDGWNDAPDSPYVDCHAWQFTPASFALLILELGEVGAADWRIDWIESQPTVEFTVHLRRGHLAFPSREAREARRMELLRQIAAELREQADWLLDDRAAPVPAQSAPGLPNAFEARMARLEEQLLPEIARGLAAIRQDLQPIRSTMEAMLPLRRAIAKLRGRI